MRRVVAAKTLEPFRLWLRFADDREGVVDLADGEFAKVRVEHEFGTVEWPGDVDLDPDGLYARLRGLPIEAVLKLP